AAMSLFQFQNYRLSEGELSKCKNHCISNANLNSIGKRLGLDQLLETAKFSPPHWAPPRYKGRASRAPAPRVVSAKMCADFVEAVGGAFMEHGGFPLACIWFQAIGLTPSWELIWEGISRIPRAVSVSVPDQSVQKVEAMLNYSFRDPTLLAASLAHPSLHKNSEFKRLEFLGDSVLELLLTKHQYSKHKTESPETLTLLRAATVCSEAFCRMAYRLDLHQHLQHAKTEAMDRYLAYLSALPPYSDPRDTDIDGPKLLCDAFEALVGALFIDCQGSWDVVWDVLYPHWKGYLDSITPESSLKSDTSSLYELLQGKGLAPDEIECKYETGA
ncbi:hypothetical protein HDU91_001284, partial [Kappamyces sp. JEL0680]